MIRRKTNKFESCKLTLEERINRLERALTSNRRSRRFENSSDVAELKSILDDWNDGYAPLHVKAVAGKIYVDYGPDDDDEYREFQLVPSVSGWMLTSDGDEIGNPLTMQQAADMIVNTISEDLFDL